MDEPILTPSEMEALLKPTGAPPAQAQVKPMDLVARDHQAFAILPSIQESSEELAGLAARLVSHLLRTTGEGVVDPVEVVPGSRISELIDEPRYAFSLKVNGAPASGLITIDEKLGGAFVARQFGGDVAFSAPAGTPTTTELRTVGRLAGQVVQMLNSVINQVSPIAAEVEDGVPRLLREPGRTQAVVLITLRIDLAGEQCAIAIVLDTAAAGFKAPAREVPRAEAPDQGPMAPAVQSLPLQLKAELGHASLSVKDFLALTRGDLILLDTPLEADLPLFIEDHGRFMGKPTVVRGNLGLEICATFKE